MILCYKLEAFGYELFDINVVVYIKNRLCFGFRVKSYYVDFVLNRGFWAFFVVKMNVLLQKNI